MFTQKTPVTSIGYSILILATNYPFAFYRLVGPGDTSDLAPQGWQFFTTRDTSIIR